MDISFRDQYFIFIFSQDFRLDPLNISLKFGAKILTRTGAVAKKAKQHWGFTPQN